MNYLAPRSGDHHVHPICHDRAGAREDCLGVRSASDEAGDSGSFVDRDLLIPLQRFFIAAGLRGHPLPQFPSLVCMLLHLFDLAIISFKDFDLSAWFEENYGDFWV